MCFAVGYVSSIIKTVLEAIGAYCTNVIVQYRTGRATCKHRRHQLTNAPIQGGKKSDRTTQFNSAHTYHSKHAPAAVYRGTTGDHPLAVVSAVPWDRSPRQTQPMPSGTGKRTRATGHEACGRAVHATVAVAHPASDRFVAGWNGPAAPVTADYGRDDKHGQSVVPAAVEATTRGSRRKRRGRSGRSVYDGLSRRKWRRKP